jgi:nucleoside-diphosphate-sugar epimerase
MKYFLTGATGFIGGRLARQLLEAGHEITALVRSPEKAQDLVQLGVSLCQGDVTDKDSMRAPMKGVDGVFHVAGWYKIGTRDKSPGQKINVDGTRNVLELMKELDIPKGVYTSTLAVNSDTHGKIVDETYRFTGEHLSEYDRTKAAAHNIAREMIAGGLPLAIVMPGMVYGPGDTSTVRTTLVNYLKGRLPIVPRETALTWAYVDDIAQGHRLAMERGKAGEEYIICGETCTLVDLMKLAHELTGKRMPLSVPPSIIRVMAGVMGVVDKIIPVPENYTGEGLRIIAGSTYIASNAKARRELDYNPRPLKEGLVGTLRHEMKLLGMEFERGA